MARKSNNSASPEITLAKRKFDKDRDLSFKCSGLQRALMESKSRGENE